MKIIQQYMTQNDCYKEGRKIAPRGIMIHNTATPSIMAKDWFSRWNKPNFLVCVHAFIDDKEVYKYLPWNHRGWHGGRGINGSVNDTHIALEMCEPAGHYYEGSTIKGYDVEKNKAYFNRTWYNTIEMTYYLCLEFGLNEKDVIGHYEGHKMGIASNHADPFPWFNAHGKTMDDFRRELGDKLSPPKAKTMYHVQVGAYGVKGNADRMVERLKKDGYDAYIKVT